MWKIGPCGFFIYFDLFCKYHYIVASLKYVTVKCKTARSPTHYRGKTAGWLTTKEWIEFPPQFVRLYWFQSQTLGQCSMFAAKCMDRINELPFSRFHRSPLVQTWTLWHACLQFAITSPLKLGEFSAAINRELAFVNSTKGGNTRALFCCCFFSPPNWNCHPGFFPDRL